MKTQLQTITLILFGIFLCSQSNAQRIDVDGVPGLHGIQVNNPGLSGLRVIGPMEMGVYVNHPGHHGLFVYAPNNSGLHTYASADDGAQLYNSTDDGLHIKNSGGQGIEVDSGSTGVYIHNQTTGLLSIDNIIGLSSWDATTVGVQSRQSIADGMWIGESGNDGMWINSSNRYGLRITGSGDDGIHIGGSTNHGIEIESGTTGIYVHNQAFQGIYSDANGREAGFFRNSSSSSFPTIYASHNNDSRMDLTLGGNGRLECDQSFYFNLDRNNSTSFGFLTIRKSSSQGSGYIFEANEQGDAFISRNLSVVGTVSKGGGTFKIDHPIDPENKYLYHSFVESPDMMNVYNGIVTLDENGQSTIVMEDWFEELNRDYRYQLTTIGGAALVYIAEEMDNGQFKIAGGKPHMKVSWQVTGIRQDAWAEQNRVQVEVEKEEFNKGKYLHPEAWSKRSGQQLEHISLKGPSHDDRDLTYEAELAKELAEQVLENEHIQRKSTAVNMEAIRPQMKK